MKQLNNLNEIDTCFIEGKVMMRYVISSLKSLPKMENTDNLHYLDRLGPMDEDWFMLLYNLLQFNPYLRWSASECLNLEIFQNVRNKILEEKPSQKILLDIDSETAFDYTTGTSTTHFLEDYISLILQEAAESSQHLSHNQTQKDIQTTKASTILTSAQSIPFFKSTFDKTDDTNNNHDILKDFNSIP